MTQELKDKWVAALRSGEYKQVKGTLCRGNGYCCLGVLLKTAGLPLGKFRNSLSYMEQKSLGLTDDLQYEYANLNDSGVSFCEISEQIEKDFADGRLQ